jgi:uncharacterized membrane protein
MVKARFLVIVMFVLALASGVVAGILATRLPAAGAADKVVRTPLAEELRLSDEQTEHMRQIWEGVRGQVDECFVRAQEVQKHRDEALLALLSDEQKVKFVTVQQECNQKMTLLKSERDAAFGQAVRRTEQILSEPQKQRYQEILKSRLSQRPAGDGPDWMMTQPALPGAGQ